MVLYVGKFGFKLVILRKRLKWSTGYSQTYENFLLMPYNNWRFSQTEKIRYSFLRSTNDNLICDHPADSFCLV